RREEQGGGAHQTGVFAERGGGEATGAKRRQQIAVEPGANAAREQGKAIADAAAEDHQFEAKEVEEIGDAVAEPIAFLRHSDACSGIAGGSGRENRLRLLARAASEGGA